MHVDETFSEIYVVFYFINVSEIDDFLLLKHHKMSIFVCVTLLLLARECEPKDEFDKVTVLITPTKQKTLRIQFIKAFNRVPIS